jgi:hypothetical protein
MVLDTSADAKAWLFDFVFARLQSWQGVATQLAQFPKHK